MVRSAVKAPAAEGCLMATRSTSSTPQGKKAGPRELARRPLRGAGQRAAHAPGRRRRARRASAPAPTRPRPAATSAAAARSRGARRAPAAPGRAPSARPSGWAAASRTARTRAITPCASTRRCSKGALRSALTDAVQQRQARGRRRARVRRAEDQARHGLLSALELAGKVLLVLAAADRRRRDRAVLPQPRRA